MAIIPYKKWTAVILLFLVVFISLNYFLWKGYTEDVLTFRKFYNGGLDRMGYIVGSKHYRKSQSTLPRKSFGSSDYRGQRVDVITIGDSFSNMEGNGLNPLYQDWIATVHDLEVMNIQALPGVYEFQTVVTLLNSGWLDKVNPRYLILETVERHCMVKNALGIDFNAARPLAEIEAYYKTAKPRQKYPDYGFLNTGNFNFLLYSLLYKFSDRAFISKVYVRELDRSFFSVKKDRQLLYYHEDITQIPLATPQTVGLMNDNLNKLSILLRKKGIALYFMPAADKYNMYSDYIVGNPYPRSVFFELLRRLPRQYVLIDTKALLAGKIQKGEKDIYYADDTHWSWKASKMIAESLTFR